MKLALYKYAIIIIIIKIKVAVMKALHYNPDR